VLLPLANAAVPGKRSEKRLVDARVEWRELAPLVQVPEGLVAGSALRELLQQRRVASTEVPALGREPPAEHGAAVDLEALKEIPLEQQLEASLRLWAQRRDAFFDGTCDLDRVNEAIGEVEPDRVPAAHDALPPLGVDKGPDLAEAPAQLAARIVRHIPQQLAKVAARNRARRQCQIGEERARLPRRGQREGNTVAAHMKAPEHLHLQGREADHSGGPI